MDRLRIFFFSPLRCLLLLYKNMTLYEIPCYDIKSMGFFYLKSVFPWFQITQYIIFLNLLIFTKQILKLFFPTKYYF